MVKRKAAVAFGLISCVGLVEAWVIPRVKMTPAPYTIGEIAGLAGLMSDPSSCRSRSHVMKAQASVFDKLGMPKIRTRGEKDEKKEEEEIAPVEEVTPPKQVPELVTMNAFGLLIEPTDEWGHFMREVLLKHFGYTVRLPRPDIFTKTFLTAYEQRKTEYPNFGSEAGLSGEEWWAPIFYKAYLDVDMPKEDIDEVFVDVFEDLYYDAMVSDWAWEPVDDILPLLDKLNEWRLEGGPKLAVVTDFDERLPTILENLEMNYYFDAVVSTREAGAAKPHPAAFKLAMEKVGVTDASKVMHFGTEFDRDVVGAVKAGMQPFWVVCPAYDELDPQQEALKLSFQKVGDLEALLDMYGRSDPDRLITTTWKNKNRPELFLQF